MRDSPNCLAQRVFKRDSSKCLAQGVFNRDSSKCLVQRTFNRDTSKCLAQSNISPDTSNCPDQRSSLPMHSSVKLKTSVLNRFGPQLRNQGKAPMKEHLGQSTGGCTQNTINNPMASRLSILPGVRESADGKRVIRKIIRDNHTMVIHARTTPPDIRPKVSPSECTKPNGQYSQKKTCPPVKDNVTLGGGSTTCDKSHQPRHHAGGGNTRRRTIDQINCSCSCAQLIKTLLSGCACSESKSLPQRVSVFKRLSLSTTEKSKSRQRRFRKRRSAIQRDEFPEVTINMVNKGKGIAAADSDPDFSARISQGGSSEDENSDSYSAMASDDTMSSVGHAREAYMITPETLAQMLQEALDKQKKSSGLK